MFATIIIYVFLKETDPGPLAASKMDSFMTIVDALKLDLARSTVAQRCSVKKVFLEISQNSQENTCARVSFLITLQATTCNVIKKETLTQVFFCEYCEISKNIFFYRTPPVAASGNKS